MRMVFQDYMRQSVTASVLFLCACGDGGGSGKVVDEVIDPGDGDTEEEVVLPQLETQIEHWSKTGVFLAAADCGQCHTASKPGDIPAVMRSPDLQVSANQPSPDGADISPFAGWKSSVMANAFTDPYYRAVMKHETEVFPHLAGFIEDTCLTCHTPMGRTHAHQAGVSLEESDSCGLEGGCYRADQAMTDPHAREGISCTVCHQITGSVLEGQVDSGNYEIADSNHPEAMTIYGPFQNPAGQAMENAVGFTPEFGLQLGDSRLCASCHELYTPTVDMATGQPNGQVFPEQTPYTEWLNSDFGPGGGNTTSCQQCHMARDEISENFQTRIAVRPNGSVNVNWPERSPFAPHVLIGGNTWLLETLELFREELGRTDINEAGEFADTANLSRELLKTAADLDYSGQSFSEQKLSFDLTIRNNTGHKLPTSFPSRRMWLATRVTDSRGTTVFESGFPDENYQLAQDAAFTTDACMAIKKPEGFDSSGCYQGHLNQVSSPEDVPVYEMILGSTRGSITHVLLYASAPLKDNRIPPRGFDILTVPDRVKPTGIDGDPDFNLGNQGQDTVAYRLPVSDTAVPPFTVESRLYYQSIRPTFIEAVTGEHSWIAEFGGVVKKNPPRAEVLASVSFQVD